MQLTDLEADKLRHLAIGRDVLVIADHNLAVPVLMLDTAQSVLAVGAPYLSPALTKTLETIRQLDYGHKVGFVLARFEAFLPVLDLAYFDLVLYVDQPPFRGVSFQLAGPPASQRKLEAYATEAADEALTLLRSGWRGDATLMVLATSPGVAGLVGPFAARTKRRLQCCDRLSILLPAG